MPSSARRTPRGTLAFATLLVLSPSARSGIQPSTPRPGAAKPDVGLLRDLHAATWNRGGVCRHAAVAVFDRARAAGLPARIRRFRTPTIRHAIPVVRMPDGLWYGFESYLEGDRWIGRSRASRALSEQPGWYEGIAIQRRLIEVLPDVPGTEIKRWRQEALPSSPSTQADPDDTASATFTGERSRPTRRLRGPRPPDAPPGRPACRQPRRSASP